MSRREDKMSVVYVVLGFSFFLEIYQRDKNYPVFRGEKKRIIARAMTSLV